MKTTLNIVINLTGIFLLCFSLGMISYDVNNVKEPVVENSFLDLIAQYKVVFFIIAALLFLVLVYASLKVNKKSTQHNQAPPVKAP